MTHPIIALLTDFGTVDPYVAQMKGTLLGLCPEAALVDLSHEVPPFGLPQAALFLQASRAHFPTGTVFVAVVDPGVGTSRRMVGLEKDGQSILAPDNGLLGPLLAAPGPMRAFDLSAHAAALEVSSTFHGRDVLAPLAAALARGESLAALGPKIPTESLARLSWAEPEWSNATRVVHATVLHVDRFGNCLTNLPIPALKDSLAAWDAIYLTTAQGSRRTVTTTTAYAELPAAGLGLLPGSQGFLELALNQADAATATGLRPGDAFTLCADTTEDT